MKRRIVKLRVPLTRQNLSVDVNFIKNKLLKLNEKFIIVRVILEIDKTDKEILFETSHINLQDNYDVEYLQSIIRDNFEQFTITNNSEAVTAKRIIFEYVKITEEKYNNLNEALKKTFAKGSSVNPLDYLN